MNRYEDEYLDEIPEENPHLGSNIKVLREEARLKEIDLANALGVSVEDIKNVEKGNLKLSTDQVEKLLPLLRIGLYDIMTRDILSERNEADKKMRRGKERSNYNWYYGNKNVVLINIIYIILIPAVYLLLAFPLRPLISGITFYIGEFCFVSKEVPFLQAYVVVSFISGILIFIKILQRINYQFRLWHLLWFTALISICIIIGVIGTIPYYIYVVVRLIILRGKNHL